MATARWAATAQRELNASDRELRKRRVTEAKAVFDAALKGVPEKEMPQRLVQIAALSHADPDALKAVVDGTAPDFIVVERARAPFAFETFESCLQDACSAAGGVWQDPEGWNGPGCYFQPGATVAEKASTTAAYTLGVFECNARSFGGFIRGLLSLV